MAISGRSTSETCAGFKMLRALTPSCIAIQGFNASKHRSRRGGNNQGALQPEFRLSFE